MEERTRSYRFFQNRDCAYFPCHEGIVADEFNCLFCFCPLYALGRACGGDCRYDEGRKDCSACTFPHRRESYDRIVERYGDIMAVAARTDAQGLERTK